MKARQLADGLGFAEGPAILPDGRVAFVEIWRGQVSVWSPGGVAAYGVVGGAPNAVATGSDGALYLTQNGGRERTWRAPHQRPPSIQRLSPDGAVEVLVTELGGVTLRAPNDLAWGADGRLYFTDPVGDFHPEIVPPPGYIFAINPDGTGEPLYDTGPTFPNGIATEADGNIIWVESFTRKIRRYRVREGRAEDVGCVSDGTVPDGLAIANNGDLYIASIVNGAIHVHGSDGTFKRTLSIGTAPTNCAFDESILYITDGGRGTGHDSQYHGGLFAVELTGVSGLPVFSGAIS